MTILQALEIITSEPKYYVGKMPQSTASCIVRNIKAGTAKPGTVKKFMAAFGFILKQQEQWEQK